MTPAQWRFRLKAQALALDTVDARRISENDPDLGRGIERWIVDSNCQELEFLAVCADVDDGRE